MENAPPTLQLLFVCRTCGEAKERNGFFAARLKKADRSSGRRGPHRPQCKVCELAAYHATKLANPVHFLFLRVKYRAKQEGTEFTITEADIFIPTHCPILGIELAPVGLRPQADEAPSLDRLDSSRGYVPGNVAVISRKANAMKGAATAEEHERIAAWMRSMGVR